MRIFSTLLCFALILSCGLIQAQVPDYVPQNGLIGWWPFNGNANDESGNGNHGIVYGAKTCKDRKGNENSAYSFNGFDNSIYLGNWFNFFEFSISIWIKPSTQSGYATVIDNNHTHMTNWVFHSLTDDYYYSWSDNPIFLKSNEWHHLVFTYKDTVGYLYHNGILEAELKSYKINYSRPTALSLGSSVEYGRFWKGEMDDVGIWNRALNSNEVSNLYKNSYVQNVTTDSFSKGKINKAINLGGNGNDNGLVVCEDYNKNLLITGNYTNSIDIHPGDSILLLNSSGLQNSYLLKVDSSFNYLYSIPIQSDLITVTRNVTVDKFNNFYLGGFFRNSVTFKYANKDTTLSAPGNFSDVFIAKYNSDGVLQWVRQLKGDKDDDISGMMVSNEGTLLVTGYCGGTIDLNPSNGQDLYTTKGVHDAYVLKLNTDGEYISGFILGSSGNTYGGYILPDVNNQFYLSGSFSQSMQLVNQKNQVITLSSKGESDGFLIKYDSTNKVVWTKSLGGSRHDGIGQSTFDKEKNLVFASYFSDSINLEVNGNHVSIKSKGDQDILLAKCDSVGNITWYSTIGSPKKDNNFYISIDDNNFLHSYSKVNDSLIVSDSKIFLNTNDYYSLITYDSSGSLKKGYSIADFYGNWEMATPANGEYGYVFYPSRHSGELIASGFYTDSIRFYNESDSLTLKSNGGRDAFIARLIYPREIQSSCTYGIKESDTSLCPGNPIEINAIQTSIIKSEIPKDGLVGYWPFNGNANDESGNGNHGIVDGASPTIDRCGKSNQAYLFDGLSNKITIEDNTLLRPTSLTCAAWVYLEDDNNLNQIVAKNAGDGPFESVDMFIHNGNGYNFLCNIGGPDYYGTWLTTPNKVQLNNWHLMTFIFDDLKDSIYSYIDDKLVAQSYEPKSITYDTLPWSFGSERENAAWSWFFKGKIDDVAIWNRPLTFDEITQVFNANSCNCEDTLSNDKFVWSDGQKGRKITVKPDTTTTYVLSVNDGTTIHRDSIKVTVGGDSCITCIYGIKQADTTICQGTVLELNAQIDTATISIPKDGLIGWWPFNGNANDESGNGNHGIVDKASLTSDKNNAPNSAYRFYKSGSKIKIPDATMLNNPIVSMSFWVKTSDTTLHSYIYKSQEGTANNEEYGIASNFTRKNSLEFSVKNGSNCIPAKGWERNIKDTVIFDGNWHHISATFDGVYSRIYVDSRLVSEIQKPLFPIDSCPGGDILFGKGWNNDANLDGILDDIAIWNRAITPAEVKTMYDLNRPKPAPSIPTNGLIGYWPFDGDAKDLSGNGLHGVVNGPLLVEDRFGNPESAYSFSGINDNIVIDTAFFDNGWDSFTFTCWVYLNETNNTRNINSNHVFLNTIPHNGLGIGYNWGNSQRYDFSVGNGKPATQWNTNLFVARGKSKFDKEQWKMVALVKSQKTYSMYVDGIKENTYECNQEIMSHFYKVALGSSDLGVCNEVLDGILDDVCIWKRALNIDEISNLYHMQKTSCTDTLPEDKFIWSTGQKGRKITVTPNASTMYTLEVDRGKIIDRDTIHVTVLESPTPDIFGHVKVYERQINHSYYTPFNDSSTYEWSITGNGKLSSTNGGSSILVDFKEPGYAYLTVTETNKNGCKRDTTITIRIYRMTDVSESEIADNGLNVFPNPMNEFSSVMVKAYLPPSKYASISIVDILGNNVFTSELDSQDSYREIHVPISTESFKNGMYMIQLRMDGNVISKKLIINR